MDTRDCGRKGRLPRSRRLRSDRGAALVEMALVVPILFVILFGIIIFGLMLSMRQNLAQAAAEGARAGAVAAAGNALVDSQTAVDQAVASFDQACGNGKLTCTITAPTSAAPPVTNACSNNPLVNCVTVMLTLSKSALPDLPIIGIFLPDSITAKSVAEAS